MGNNFFSINIDFEQSHLFFPKIIIVLLIVLAIILAVQHLPRKIKQIKKAGKVNFFSENYDKLKLFGSIAIIALYFKMMEVIGGFFPNMGYGFLIMSIIFIFAISILFVQKPTKRQMVAIVINSLATPVFAWYVFGVIFGISLP